MSSTREPSRRELNKADKQRRIHRAARELFFSRGYSSVTTQEVAERAGVGTGTLFRYARSKGELLCMVANQDLRMMVESLPDTGDPVDDLVGLCEPLFGEPGPHRNEAQQILLELRGSIAEVLSRHSGGSVAPAQLAGPAQTVFDVIYMTIVRCGVDRSPDLDHRRELRKHVRRVLHGALPAASVIGADRN